MHLLVILMEDGMKGPKYGRCSPFSDHSVDMPPPAWGTVWEPPSRPVVEETGYPIIGYLQLCGKNLDRSILKKNVELHAASKCRSNCSGLAAEKLEWGDDNHIKQISDQYPGGFDLVLGDDIYILQFHMFSS
ncbi:hypothetical protein IFM89_025738 [Coptis chinensis]|uniref:Uncharacterized protein n=1 Tax=Coptis chinensis TaxID=261450 RepID=A0A835LWJ8_9MAGN|nr:hypothetical protein IFM89_025738 [Coptis chinensis]